MADVVLKVTDLYAAYGKIEALKGISLEVKPGRDRDAHRRQRCRQVHDAQDDLGSARSRRAAPSSIRASRSAARSLTSSPARASSRFPRVVASSRA